MVYKQGKWIWEKENKIKNDWVQFRKNFQVTEMKSYQLKISADTRYFLYINGEICVWDGGLFRDAYCENSGYFDEVDITPYIKLGENILEVLVWHYGNGGRNNNPLPYAGVIFECNELNLFSDYSTLCQRHLGFREEKDNSSPSYLYGGYNINYDARWNLEENNYHFSTEYDKELYGTIFERPIPMLYLSQEYKGEYVYENGVYKVKLDSCHQVLPCFEVIADGGEIIEIYNDRYCVPGGPGDGGKAKYLGHRTKYICKQGRNYYLNYDYVACECLEFVIPKGVKIAKLGYRISEYDTKIMPLFTCNNVQLNKLVKKSARTLKVCMRDNFMDCPDRERGQWIGDVSVQAPQIFYMLDHKAVMLLKKAIYNFICLRKRDCLVGNVPGIHYQELPSQSLNAISEFGMISTYYNFTGDKEILKLCLEPMVKYLMLWDMDENGMVICRKGDWYWFDHHFNQDKIILENTWYYSALKFSKKISLILDDQRYSEFLNQRISSIRDSFERLFWKEKYYSSGIVVDDRANAMAVLTGLASSEHYEDIKNILLTTFNASTYMEGYVCEALVQMGYIEQAYLRILNRYNSLINNDNSTLWEDFMILGTKNHAWTGGPATLIYKYLAGISVDGVNKIISINPNFSIITEQKYTMDIMGDLLEVDIKLEGDVIKGSVNNYTSYSIKWSSNLNTEVEFKEKSGRRNV